MGCAAVARDTSTPRALHSTSLVASSSSYPPLLPHPRYADFVWFLLAEEDKSTPSSASFWFRVLDTDGDGQVSMVEMEYFYLEQQARLREVAQARHLAQHRRPISARSPPARGRAGGGGHARHPVPAHRRRQAARPCRRARRTSPQPQPQANPNPNPNPNPSPACAAP